jgi:hypothetical protein
MRNVGNRSHEGASDSQNLVINILEHPSVRRQKQKLGAVPSEFEWKRVEAESDMNGALVDHIDRYFMEPSSFQPSTRNLTTRTLKGHIV